MYCKTLLTTALLTGFLLSWSLPSMADTRLYRWVEENGNVYYSDKLPPDQAGQAHSKLNERGFEVERVGAAKMPEEIEHQKELNRLHAEQQQLIEQQRKKNQVLLRTFQTEEDIERMQNGKLAVINRIIHITHNKIKRMKAQLAKIQKNAASMEQRGETVTKPFLDDIESRRQQIKENYAFILYKEQDKEAIQKQFQADLYRFRKLKNLNTEKNVGMEQAKVAPLLKMVVPCGDKAHCDALWEGAEAYVRKHTTTQMQILSDTIIMTASPLDIEDISITVSRIQKKEQPGAQLFMDLQCNNSPQGQEFCASGAVETIRSGFHIYLKQYQP